MKQITITIDGPAGSGKGTAAKGVANKLGYNNLDSGSLYRAITYFCLQNDLTPQSEGFGEKISALELEINEHDQVVLNGQVLTNEIRTEVVNRNVSTVYAHVPLVRDIVTKKAQQLIRNGGYVIDGRDAATKIAPGAELKVYLDCDAYVRALRRAHEFGEYGEEEIQEVLNEIVIPRDEADRHDLKASREAGVTIDTTDLTIEETVQKVCELAHKII